ncbi:hypothetical protein FIV42_04160 [Persicimonas caeni]|uniref:Exo-alpha-sialidase n=1 Tax=Persicimonas caeni TaxID=2292766 RepID=A0A4Y6PNX9_PERCE|nr:hypothetical protein [Persicimonas caeni]QDG49960.1 hypothetical protein FIV42_04160 [Persicimonas caeni]QED31181.1 hypothetical protein FRD00_04155 [Persicimonas caeni]
MAAIAATMLLGCGGDDSGTNEGHNVANNTVEDAGTGDIRDASSDATSYDTSGGDTAADAAEPSRYEPSLSDLGAPPANCTTSVVNSTTNATETRARLFVPSYRIDFDALSSHRAFREHIHEMVHEKVLPCRAEASPNVVVFPESMGLPMWLIGDKASAARGFSESTQALTAMVGQVQQAYTYYGEKFPDTSITSRFVLAMTDPVVRATYDTFGRIADRYDLYVSVTVDLPDFQKTTDASVVSRLADPDFDTHDYAYEATSPKVHNRQILFGPDGEVVDETLKTYVTAMELDQLALAAGDFTDIHPMQTPWGRTGVVISKPAWMPDVQDRLDDLGAEVIFQPEAFFGGWVPPLPPDTPEEQVRWEPDLFMLGGWNLVQRAPRATHNFVSQLTGNFFEMTSDAQVQIIEKAARASGSGEFVGQRGPLSGNTFIGPWVVEDPGLSEPNLTLAQRRERLRDVGAKLLPGSGDPLEGEYVQGMWAADLSGPATTEPVEVQTHPQLAVVEGATYVVSSRGAVGERTIAVEIFEGGSLTGSFEQATSGYDVIRPAIATDGTKLHIVAELVGKDENRLLYTSFDPAQRAFVDSGKLIDTNLVGEWAFHPSIAVVDTVLHMSWIKRVGNANRAFYAQTSLAEPFANLAVNAELEPRPDNRAELEANQWDARVAVDAQAIAVTWIDFKNWQWEVMVSVSTDGGLGWSEPVRVDAVPDGVEALSSTPAITSLGGGEFMIAWTDARATRPNTRIATRTISVAGDAMLSMGAPQRLGEAAPFDQWMWRPAFVETANGPAVVYETLVDNAWSIELVEFDADGTAEAPMALVDATQTAKHFAAAQATNEGFQVVFEEVGPAERGASDVVLHDVLR